MADWWPRRVRAHLDAVFTPGTRLGVRRDDPLTFGEVVEVARVTSIRVPSGRLVVDTPWLEDGEPRELAVRVPPGAYGVDVAWTEAPYEFMGGYFSGREVAATRLSARVGTVAVWEAPTAGNGVPARAHGIRRTQCPCTSDSWEKSVPSS
ncbi:hypothetical protein [Streptomyces lavendulae]|uniref:hypothetical protein n=1 Tax=Streptomyces lavendulae TaxID=1914 RepID=UPI0024A1E910|nr:hypothetical protein [Streptomyces lavendulae]GLW04198.1 hypothetical protein Slala05_78280 [Streptomyces lavendulae subsp. lavendulae]